MPHQVAAMLKKDSRFDCSKNSSGPSPECGSKVLRYKHLLTDAQTANWTAVRGWCYRTIRLRSSARELRLILSIGIDEVNRWIAVVDADGADSMLGVEKMDDKVAEISLELFSIEGKFTRELGP
jgi:hypothetical protein